MPLSEGDLLSLESDIAAIRRAGGEINESEEYLPIFIDRLERLLSDIKRSK